MNNRRTAITLVEVLVVLAIFATMIGLLLPAIQASREKAREMVCKNNVHQLNLAVAQFAQANKKLPAANPPGVVGGWTIRILPFVEQADLEESIRYGMPVADAQDFLLRAPAIFRCPAREVRDDRQEGAMQPGHYVLVASGGRDTYTLYDAPLELSVPWASGPEMAPHTATRQVGPHHGGFFCALGFQQGVDFEPGSP
jgi:type II secretory pathway pseudopilin PulG